jgi:hypothetical protein
MDDFDEAELPLRTVTCHTPGCVNQGHTVTFPCLEVVICGGCGQQITDVVTV